MALRAGTRLGPYEIFGFIGAGGMGEVYKATDRRLDRTVAIKVLPTDISNDPRRRARFEGEAKTIASLSHPHICTLYDVGTHDGLMFLVMEHLAGETLEQRLRRGPLPLKQALALVTQIAEALSTAHAKGIVHCDLKPGNVMLTANGAKLLDFGLARHAEQDALPAGETTRTAVPVIAGGTPPYMSPEQALGRGGDQRSDLFSLGVMLYEMVAGRRPFSGSTPYELAESIVHTDPVPVTFINSEVPSWLERTIAACLEKRADMRPPTAAALLHALRASDVESLIPAVEAEDRNNLPYPLTRFIGRRNELAAIHRAFKDARLVTLTGPGGIGKTRLALQVAAELGHENADGVWWVELGSLTDAALIPSMVASTLGVREEAGRPIGELVLEQVKSKHVLIVFDNCEHLITACAQLADLLLRGAPHLRILATSQESLTIAGETVLRVAPLSLPDPRQVSDLVAFRRHESVELFMDRARTVKPAFEITPQNVSFVARLCIQLDGIPLAIELAASRLKVLSIEQIATRLNDRFALLTGGNRTALPRHRTLLAAIDWSYNLLSESERRLFRRLAVFTGGWTLEAAETVCTGTGVSREDILDLMSGLVDKSLVVVEESNGQPRYRFMVTLRKYAQGHLHQSGEQRSVARLHSECYLHLVLEAESRLETGEQRAWLDRLNAEYDNIRAALKWMLSNRPQSALRVAGALRRFWYLRGYATEGRKWLEQALCAPDALASSQERISVLNAMALLAENQGDLEAARSFSEEALTLSRACGDQRETALALNCLAIVAGRQCEFELARTCLEEVLAIWRILGDEGRIAITLSNAGILTLLQGDCASARSLFDESLRISRQAGDQHKTATVLLNRAEVARRMGDYDEAKSLVEEGFAIAKDLGDRALIPIALHSLGDLARHRGDWRGARTLLLEALRVSRHSGEKRLILDVLASLALVTDHDPTAQSLLHESLAIAKNVGDRRGIARALNALGHFALRQGEHAAAQSLFDEGFSIAQSSGLKDDAAHSLNGLGKVARLRGNWETACSFYGSALTVWWEMGGKPEVAQVLEEIGTLMAARRRSHDAVRLWAAADRLRSAIALSRSATEMCEHDERLTATKRALGESKFAALWAEGRTLETSAVIAQTLQGAATDAAPLG